MKETTVSSEKIYEGRIISCRKDQVQLPNGKTTTREVVDHDPAVVILPILDNNTMMLVKQYRYAISDTLLEAPAGGIEQDEDPLEAAKRELIEETGIVAQTWEKVAGVYLAPGFCNEFMHVYIAKDIQIVNHQSLDEDEFVECVTLSFQELEAKIKAQTIRDGKTVMAYLLAKETLNKTR